jgi:hypothetical protein
MKLKRLWYEAVEYFEEIKRVEISEVYLKVRKGQIGMNFFNIACHRDKMFTIKVKANLHLQVNDLVILRV